jgi:hypothetical protein
MGDDENDGNPSFSKNFIEFQNDGYTIQNHHFDGF